jgi:hypothetical protein
MNTIKRIINIIKNHNKISKLVYGEILSIGNEIQRKEFELENEELWFEEKGLEPTLFLKNGNNTKWGEAISEIAVLKSRRRPLEQLQKLIMRGGE